MRTNNLQNEFDHGNALLPLKTREALAARAFDAIIHAALNEIGKYRSLTRAEIRLRCTVAPRPWRAEGVSPSTYFRRRRRARTLPVAETRVAA